MNVVEDRLVIGRYRRAHGWRKCYLCNGRGSTPCVSHRLTHICDLCDGKGRIRLRRIEALRLALGRADVDLMAEDEANPVLR